MNEKFLDKYRELENELKADGMTVLEYENEHIEAMSQEKMKLCRIVRNYLIHNDKEFITASRNMVSFLGDTAKHIHSQRELAKDRMVRRKPVHVGDTIKSVIPMCAKGVVPVTDSSGKFLFLIDADYIVGKLAKGKTKIDKTKPKKKYSFVSKEEALKDLSGTYIVTTDGTAKGKYLGILIV